MILFFFFFYFFLKFRPIIKRLFRNKIERDPDKFDLLVVFLFYVPSIKLYGRSACGIKGTMRKKSVGWRHGSGTVRSPSGDIGTHSRGSACIKRTGI